MAYPFSNDQPSNAGFTFELDPTALNYGASQQVPAANGLINTSINASASAPNQAAGAGLNGVMDLFRNIFNSDSMFGGVNQQTGQQAMGWAMPLASLFSGVLGMQQANKAQKLAGDQLKESRRQFDLNYGAQRQSINTELEDRQRARVASAGGSGAYEAVDSYLDRNRIR